jgi:para-nitrobenzyl esterase
MKRETAAGRGLVSPSAAGAEVVTVRVEGGAILGATSADGAVVRFLGVPYAAPPKAALRWRPPRPVAPWQGVLETLHTAPAGPQPLPPPGSFYQNEFFRASERQSEDCLYLNIWTPAREPDEKLPVMVWFHGGAFLQGSGSLRSFDGEALARRGVAVVTLNYRLGPLGFLALPALDDESPEHVSGNYGLLDMAAALRWTRDNIAAFRGDPGKVTIFGQSAGAVGVNAMMASPLARGLFLRAIVQSCPMYGFHLSEPMQTLAEAEEGGERFMRALGARTLADLRSIASTDLVRAMGAAAASFGPRPNVDGHVLPRDPAETIASGQGHGTGLLIGANANEGTVLLPPASPEALAALIHARFGAQREAIAKLYNGSDERGATSAQDRLQSDYLIAASAREAAAFANQGRPAYLYRFTRPAPGSDPVETGAFHSAELAYVFGTQASIGRPWSELDRELSGRMRAYWTNFAKTGDPNGPGLPRWPRYDSPSGEAMELGDAAGPAPVLDPERKTLFDAYLAART